MRTHLRNAIVASIIAVPGTQLLDAGPPRNSHIPRIYFTARKAPASPETPEVEWTIKPPEPESSPSNPPTRPITGSSDPAPGMELTTRTILQPRRPTRPRFRKSPEQCPGQACDRTRFLSANCCLPAGKPAEDIVVPTTGTRLDSVCRFAHFTAYRTDSAAQHTHRPAPVPRGADRRRDHAAAVGPVPRRFGRNAEMIVG